MRLLLCLAVLLAVACSPAPAPSQTPVSIDLQSVTPSATPSREKETLAQYAKRTQGAQAYGIYLLGKKTGWSLMRSKLVQRKGYQVLAYREEIYIEISRGGQKDVIHNVSERDFALTGDGPILQAREKSQEGGTTTEISVHPAGNQMEVVTRSQGRMTKRKVVVSRDTLRQAQDFEIWLESARPGDTFAQWNASWTEDPAEQEDEITYRGREEIVWGGVRTEMNQVAIKHGGASADVLLQNDGTPWRAKLAGIMEMRAEEETTARKLDAPVDMLNATSIKVQRPVSSQEDLEHLVLEVEGIGDFQLPASHRQKAYQKDGKTFWEFHRDARVQAAEPLTVAQRAEYTRGTPALQTDAVITSLARKIAGQGTPVEQAGRLESWIYKNLQKTYSKNASTARDVLANKAGDCTEHARLFTAMARSLGIPAREVAGLVSAAPQPMFGWHAWAEIHDGHQWVSVDPMWDQVYVDATHLKMANGADDFSWVNVAGSMKVTVK